MGSNPTPSAAKTIEKYSGLEVGAPNDYSGAPDVENIDLLVEGSMFKSIQMKHLIKAINQLNQNLKHKGKILEKAVRKSLVPIATVGKELGFKTGRHMYNLFKKEDLPFELFIRTGRVIGYDFAKDLPEITQFLMIKEPQEAANLNNAYQLKYLELLEKFVELTNEYDKLKNSLSPIDFTAKPSKKHAK